MLISSEEQEAFPFDAALQEGSSSVAAQLGRPTDPHSSQILRCSLADHSLVEVVLGEFDLALETRQLVCVFADPQDHFDCFAVVAEVHELVQRDGVDVFWLVDGDEEQEGVLGERMSLENGVFPQNYLTLGVSLCQPVRLKQEVDDVAKGIKTSSSSQYDDSARWRVVQLESSASRATHLYIFVPKFVLLKLASHFAVFVYFEHDGEEGTGLLVFLFLLEEPFAELSALLHQLQLCFTHFAQWMQAVFVQVQVLQIGDEGNHESHVVQSEEIDCSVQTSGAAVEGQRVVLPQLLQLGVSSEAKPAALHSQSQFIYLRLFGDGMHKADACLHDFRGEALKGGSHHKLRERRACQPQAIF